MTNMKDIQIINGIRSKDESAINCAMNKYSRLLWKVAATVLTNTATAEDIEECVADVFVYLWRNCDKFDEQRGELKSWLCSVAKSKAIDRFRKLSKSASLSLDDDIAASGLATASVIDTVMDAETKVELVAAVNALNEVNREIVIRRYYYQQKPKEIGFALDLPVKQVENRLYRSKLQLREILMNGGI